jgi:hypothetical protein
MHRYLSIARLLRLWAIASAFLLCGAAAHAQISPYLQTPSSTAIWVTWKTAAGTESRVELGTAQDQLTRVVNGSAQQLASNYIYHSAQLTGLQPNTFYYYRVKTGTETSQVHRFKTQPAIGAQGGHIRFLVMGDNQIIADNRYEKLVRAAKAKLESLYGEPVESAVNLVVNVGDQVDVGTLEQYEKVHFKMSAPVSGNLPIMTTVGNHEYYYDGSLALYQAHFIYQGLTYKGIPSAPNESYYANQVGRVLFLHLNSMNTDAAQETWLRSVINAADQDSSVDWVISLLHHPYQAEQYVGDISQKFRSTWMAVLANSKKHVLNIGGHHHLYARGQTRDWPIYHMISGGTAWDQYWGQSKEENFDDVQKTIANWAWQIVDIDIANRSMKVETYAEAHPIVYQTAGFNYHSKLIDSFSRKLDSTAPSQPSLLNSIASPVSLPYTFNSSSFVGGGSDTLNSTQFQIASDPNFLNLAVDRIRDFEDIYGDTGAPLYNPVDVNQGVNILHWTVPAYGLPNGSYYVRVRHRDSNVEWSPWSESKAFRVTGSTNGVPAISITKSIYAPSEAVVVTHANGYGKPKDWIGVYRKGQTPGGSSPSVQYKYVSGPNGSVSFTGLPANQEYFAAFFTNDTYEEIAGRVSFFVGSKVDITLGKTEFAVGETVDIAWINGPAGSKDWIGVYRVGDVPGTQTSTKWQYTTTNTGTASITGLGKGYYYAAFFLNDLYFEASERVYFSVGSQIANVSMPSTVLAPTADFTVNFSNGPGTPKDYMGIFKKGATPGVDVLVDYLYVDGKPTGSVTFTTDIPDGEYFLALYINDSYTEVSNRVDFKVGNGSSPTPALHSDKVSYRQGLPVVLSWANTPGGAKDWIGVYRVGTSPGAGSPSVMWKYAPTSSGEAAFPGLAKGSYYAAFFINDSYTEIVPRVNFTVRPAGDLTGDGLVDVADRNLLRQSLGKCLGTAGYNSEADYDGDSCITQLDYQSWYSHYTNP